MGYDRGDRFRGERFGYDRGYDRDRGGYRPSGNRYGGGYGPRDRYDYDEDRGFFDRAADEVRSWFGDEDAERRRERDEYYNRPYGDPRDQSSRLGFAPGARPGYAPYAAQQGDYTAPSTGRRDTSWHDHDRDADYGEWRRNQLSDLDRDYHEYRTENRARFNQEFNSWRDRRTTQRSTLNQVQEHAEVVGSDGEHVGKVDKVRGDQIILTKNDQDAHGHHHSIPSRWIDRIENGQVILEKTAAQAQQLWRDAERRGAIGGQDRDYDPNGPHYLDNAFSGTYRNR